MGLGQPEEGCRRNDPQGWEGGSGWEVQEGKYPCCQQLVWGSITSKWYLVWYLLGWSMGIAHLCQHPTTQETVASQLPEIPWAGTLSKVRDLPECCRLYNASRGWNRVRGSPCKDGILISQPLAIGCLESDLI